MTPPFGMTPGLAPPAEFLKAIGAFLSFTLAAGLLILAVMAAVQKFRHRTPGG